MSNGSDELPLNYTIPFMPLWKESVMLCSLCWQPLSGRTLKVQYQCEGFSLLTRSNDLVSSLKAKENDICCSLRFFSNIVKWRRQCLLLTLQLGSQTLCKLLDADHDGTRKYFVDDGQKTDISISAAGYFGDMKRRRHRPKDGELAGVLLRLPTATTFAMISQRRDRLYYQVSTVTVP